MKQSRVKISSRRRINNRDMIYVDLDTTCSCAPSTLNNDASIQFTRRYLQCHHSMSIGILRLFIQTLLPYAPIVEVSIFDSNNRLLKDSDRLRSLKHTYSSSHHIPLRFTLINTITSLAHCACLSTSIENDGSSCPTVIQPDTIEQILSTYSPTERRSSISPCLSSSPCQSPIGIWNPLTPSPFAIDSEPDESMIDLITAKYGEICPTLPESKQYHVSKKTHREFPLDLSMKKTLIKTSSSLFCDIVE